MPNGERIAELLLNIGAVKLSIDPPFTWTSGMKAPIYCDNRMLYSHPDARDFVVQSLLSRVRSLHIEPDVIAGTATAGIGWAALVASFLRLPFVYIRHKAKDYGTGKNIEGDLLEGKHVVVVEDLFSTGGSAVRSVEVLREEGKCTVSDVVAIFSYELLKAAEKAQQFGVAFHPLSTFSVLLKVAEQQGTVSEEHARIAADFVKDPENWFERAALPA